MNPRCHYSLTGRNWPKKENEYIKRLIAFAAGAGLMAVLAVLAK